jgi:drug/metabolite transporter (DMT)-like permease
MLLVLSAANGEHVRSAMSPQSLIALAYLIAFGSMIAFSAYGYLLKTVTPALATSNTLVNPMVAVLIGVALGGEPFDMIIVAAMAVILLGVALLAIVKDPPQEPS